MGANVSELKNMGWMDDVMCAKDDLDTLQDAIRSLHKPDELGEFCTHDGFIWPCGTIRLLTDCNHFDGGDDTVSKENGS